MRAHMPEALFFLYEALIKQRYRHTLFSDKTLVISVLQPRKIVSSPGEYKT